MDIAKYQNDLSSILSTDTLQEQLESAKKQALGRAGAALVEGSLPLLVENKLVKRGFSKAAGKLGQLIQDRFKTKSSDIEGQINEGLENLKNETTQAIQRFGSRITGSGLDGEALSSLEMTRLPTVPGLSGLSELTSERPSIQDSGEQMEDLSGGEDETSLDRTSLTDDDSQQQPQQDEDPDLSQADDEAERIGSEAAEEGGEEAGEVSGALAEEAAADEAEPGFGSVLGLLAGIGSGIAGAVELAEKHHHHPLLAQASTQFGV